MRKLASTILVAVIVFSGLLFFEDAQATLVGGTLTSNTTWTRENSPYRLSEKLKINSGVTLSIESGVTVNFQSCQMEVNGVLRAVGTSSDRILLTSSSGSTQKIEFTALSSDCIIKNAIITEVPILVSNASPEISYNYFTGTPYYTISVNGGSPTITDNVINFQSSNGIHVNSGTPTISGNVIRGEGQNYGIYTSGCATVIGNNITNCYTGIYAVGQTLIRQNIVMNNVHDGIRSDYQSSSIEYNVAANNDCGISGNGHLLHNTVAHNAVAGLWSPSPLATIYKNNIYGNPESVHLTENATDVQAPNNWWGTTDPEAIDASIWDVKDASHLGNLFYTPFLTELDPSAPSVPSSIPIPTEPPLPATNTPNTPNPTDTATQEPTAEPSPPKTLSPTRMPYVTEAPVTPPRSGKVDLTGIVVVSVAIVIAIALFTVITRFFHRSPAKTP